MVGVRAPGGGNEAELVPEGLVVEVELLPNDLHRAQVVGNVGQNSGAELGYRLGELGRLGAVGPVGEPVEVDDPAVSIAA